MEWGPPSKIRKSPGFIEPCIPTLAKAPPAGEGWLHEIKHDGYRVIVRRAGKRVRVYTRRGYDWTEHFPLIVEAVGGLRSDHLDGEADVRARLQAWAGRHSLEASDSRYRSGRSKDWVKVKNPDSQAMPRLVEE